MSGGFEILANGSRCLPLCASTCYAFIFFPVQSLEIYRDSKAVSSVPIHILPNDIGLWYDIGFLLAAEAHK
jgi:hypothetical protein